MDQRSLLKVSMKSRSEQMKLDREKASRDLKELMDLEQYADAQAIGSIKTRVNSSARNGSK